MIETLRGHLSEQSFVIRNGRKFKSRDTIKTGDDRKFAYYVMATLLLIQRLEVLLNAKKIPAKLLVGLQPGAPNAGRFSVKYLFGEANIALNFVLLEDG